MRLLNSNAVAPFHCEYVEQEKQARSQELNEEIVKLPKNLNRLLYTHRIMDITASIAKQNVDIEKITDDIREIRKTINAHNSILQRAGCYGLRSAGMIK